GTVLRHSSSRCGGFYLFFLSLKPTAQPPSARPRQPRPPPSPPPFFLFLPRLRLNRSLTPSHCAPSLFSLPLARGWLMKYLQETFCALLAQQSGQIQFLIIAPILTLSFLSLIVRTANSAIDPALEKRKVTEQLKRRLSEVQNHEEILPALVVETP